MPAAKKIIIIQDYLRNGGTERQSVHLARALAQTGHEVTLLTFRPGGALAPDLKSPRDERDPGDKRDTHPPTPGAAAPSDNPKSALRNPQSAIRNPQFLSLQPFDTRLDFFAPRLHATLRRLAPDIILCMGRMANCKAGRLARAFPRVAVISTMRTGKNLPRAYVRSLHATRHVIANSHESARLLRARHAVPAEKITVIHNALLTDVARAASPCGRAKPPAEPAGATGCQPVSSSGLSATGCQPVGSSDTGDSPVPRLLCAAMFRPEKNHRELLEIFAKLPTTLNSEPGTLNPELHLIGDGPELPPCRALAQKLNIAARVHFHGYLADPAPFYQPPANANTIAVLTSRSESLPNFLVEAHAHGIPSVAYATGGVAECGGIVIPPNDQPAFLAALTNLLTSPAARAAESARVAAHAREHFSPETQLHLYLALFDKLIS